MKTTTNTILAAIAASAAFLAGCATHGYGPGNEVNFVNPDVASLTDMTRTTEQMVNTLLVSPAFKSKYDSVKSKLGNKSPAIQVANFENRVVQLADGEDTRQYTPKLEICRGKAREALQNSGLFTIVEAVGAFGSSVDDLKGGMTKDVDEGLVDTRILQGAGTYTPADFRMSGNFERIQDGKRFYYILEVRLHDLATHEFWTTTQIFDKF